jgi:hypothetical protein
MKIIIGLIIVANLILGCTSADSTSKTSSNQNKKEAVVNPSPPIPDEPIIPVNKNEKYVLQSGLIIEVDHTNQIAYYLPSEIRIQIAIGFPTASLSFLPPASTLTESCVLENKEMQKIFKVAPAEVTNIFGTELAYQAGFIYLKSWQDTYIKEVKEFLDSKKMNYQISLSKQNLFPVMFPIPSMILHQNPFRRGLDILFPLLDSNMRSAGTSVSVSVGELCDLIHPETELILKDTLTKVHLVIGK